MPLLPISQQYGSVHSPTTSHFDKPLRSPSSKDKKRRSDQVPKTPSAINAPFANLSDGERRNACPECQRVIPNSVWYSSENCPYCHKPLIDDSSSDEKELAIEAGLFEDEEDLSPELLRHLLNERARKKEAEEIEAKPVAEWMVEQLNEKGEMFQRDIVFEIERRFGSQFIYRNHNGNPAISERVLAVFRKLTEQSAVWDKTFFLWRKRRPSDDPKKRDVE